MIYIFKIPITIIIVLIVVVIEGRFMKKKNLFNI